MANLYGLIGYPLSHSFSKKYFEDKFLEQGLSEHRYELFELKNISELNGLLEEQPDLVGLNVTIPYKEVIIPLLDHIDESAKKVGAVNVIKIEEKTLTGYNSDYFGFENSLLKWLPQNINKLTSLIFGTGGASKAVEAVLIANKIPYKLVSRTKNNNTITYKELRASPIATDSKLLINTTPLGMSPTVDAYPDIDYSQISKNHFVFDLIYNPQETRFLKKARSQGAQIKNGLEMLQLQAEKSWEIWTS